MNDLDKFIMWTNGLSVRPAMVMQDGFNMSVQASENHYCNPKENDIEHYSSFEIGFPSKDEPLLEGYEADEDIYVYVPKGIVERIIEKHGGISFDKSIEGFSIRYEKIVESISLARNILEKLKEIEEVGEFTETTQGFKLMPFYIPFYEYDHYPLFEEGWAYPDDPPAPLIQELFDEIEEEYQVDCGNEYFMGNRKMSGIPILISARKTTAYSNDLEDAQNNLYGEEGSSYISEMPAIDQIIQYSYELLRILKDILESIENAYWIDEDFRWYEVGNIEIPDGDRMVIVPAVFIGDIGDNEWDFYITDGDFISGDIKDFIARLGSGYEIKHKFGNADEYYVEKVGD